jgi:quercetin dioxygenase-like cupin family protein
VSGAGRSDAGVTLTQSDEADEDGAAIIAVEEAVNRLRGPIYQCWVRGAADDFRLAGRVVLAVRIGEGGKTAATEVVEDTARDPVLTGCLEELWAGYEWPVEAIAVGETVQLPMEFSAPAAQYVVSSAHVPPRPLGGERPAAASKAQVLLHSASSGNEAAALSLLEMAPGLEIPLHRHTSIEVVYVLSGQAQMTDLRGKRVVKPGDAVYLAPGTAHGLKNAGKEPVVAVQLYAPAGPELRFLGKPPVGTEPVGAAERKRPGKAARPLIRATSSARARPLEGGKGRVSPLFAPEEVYLGALTGEPGLVMPVEADPGGSLYVYVIEGGAVLTVAGQEVPIGAGDAVQVPTGIARGLRVGDGGVKALWFHIGGDHGRWKP